MKTKFITSTFLSVVFLASVGGTVMAQTIAKPNNESTSVTSAVIQTDPGGECKAWLRHYIHAYNKLHNATYKLSHGRSWGYRPLTPQEEATLRAEYHKMPSICSNVEGFQVPSDPFDNDGFGVNSHP